MQYHVKTRYGTYIPHPLTIPIPIHSRTFYIIHNIRFYTSWNTKMQAYYYYATMYVQWYAPIKITGKKPIILS